MYLKVIPVFFLLSCLSYSQSLPFGLFSASVSGNTQTINSDCSKSTPCQISVAGQVVSFTSPSTVTVPIGGSDMVFEYIDPLSPSVVMAGDNVTALTCGAGAKCVTGVKSFPVGSFPLYQWPVANGVWQAYDASFDKRSLMSAPVPLVAGAGISITRQNGQITISVDNSSAPVADSPSSQPVPVSTAPSSQNWYQIVNSATGKCLSAIFTYKMLLADCSTTDDNQLFSIIPAQSYYQIASKGQNASWNVWNNSMSDGLTLGLYTFSNTDNTLFSITPNTSSGVTIVSKSSKLCASIDSTLGATLVQSTCNASAKQQQFVISLVGE